MPHPHRECIPRQPSMPRVPRQNAYQNPDELHGRISVDLVGPHLNMQAFATTGSLLVYCGRPTCGNVGDSSRGSGSTRGAGKEHIMILDLSAFQPVRPSVHARE